MFKPGDEVELVHQKNNSSHNLEVGATGTVLEVRGTPFRSGNQILIKWDSFIICAAVYATEAIELINLNLENK